MSGKGLFGKVGDLAAKVGLVEEIPDATQAAVPAAQQPSAPGFTMPTSGAVAPVSIAPLRPTIDPALIEHLNGKVIARRTAYTSLLEAAEKLRPFIPDDMSRFKAAALQVGSDKNAILQAIDVHLTDLNTEANNFNRFAASEAQAKVATLNAAADAADKKATGDDARIQQLQQEIANLQTDGGQARAAAADSRNKAQAEQADLDRKGESFNAAFNAVKSNLTAQKTALASAL